MAWLMAGSAKADLHPQGGLRWMVCDVTVHGSPQGRKGPPTHERGGTQHNQASKPPRAPPSPCQGTEVPWTYQWENPQGVSRESRKWLEE